MARLSLSGHCQYKTIGEGLNVDLWLTTWERDNAGIIQGFGGHSVEALIPPFQEEGDEDVCVCQVTFEYTLDHTDEGVLAGLRDAFVCQVAGACEVGLTTATGALALCSSSYSIS